MTFELHHLRYALSVAEFRSFRRAADVLGINQSALSRRIRDLEDQIGVSLFERHHEGVRLTTAGEHFLADVRRALLLIDRSIANAGHAGRGALGRIAVGRANSFPLFCLQRVLHRFHAQLPEAELTLIEAPTSQLIESLFDRSIDVALICGDVQFPGLDTLQLKIDKTYVALSSEHPLAGNADISLSALCAEKIHVPRHDCQSDFYRILNQNFEKEMDVVVHDCTCEGVLCLVAAGHGLALVSELSAAICCPNVCFLPLEATASTLSLTAIWHPGTDNPVFRRMLGVLRQKRDFYLQNDQPRPD